MYKVAGKRTQREKKTKQITNLNKAAFLLRPVRSYYVLTARPQRPLRVYGVSIEIYGLGNGDHGRSRGALTTTMGFLPRVFYVYRDCTATSGYLLPLTWWWTRNTVMKTTWSWWGRHEIVVVVRTYAMKSPRRVLRLWRCYDAWLTTFATPPRSHRVPGQIAEPISVCFEHAQNKRRDSAIIGDHGDYSAMSGVSTTTFIPRLWWGGGGAWWPWRALGPFFVAVEAQ